MGTAPATVISPPSTVPQWHSLVASSEKVYSPDATVLGEGSTVSDSDRWEGGFSFWPNDCTIASPWNPCPVPPALSTVGKSQATTSASPVSVDPWIAEAPFRCSTYGMDIDGYARRAVDTLVNSKTKVIEQVYEFPDSAVLPGLTALSLVGGTTNTLNAGVATSPEIGLAMLGQFLGECAGGNAGLIHATSSVASLMAREASVVRDGDKLRTTVRGDTLVVGSGYRGLEPVTGNAPPLNQYWVYATGPVSVYLGGIVVTPDTIEEATTRSTNDVEYRAECPVAVFDDLCCRAAVLVDITL